MENLKKLMAMISMIIVAPIVSGFVFCKLWLWFVVPTFQSEPLRLIETIGLVLLVRLITLSREKTEKGIDFWVKYKDGLRYFFAKYSIGFFAAWLISLFM